MTDAPATTGTAACRAVQYDVGSSAAQILWLIPDNSDHLAKLDATCRSIGPVAVTVPRVPDSASRNTPDVGHLVVVSWNTYLGRGDLPALYSDLTRGGFTDGQRVEAFALLLQEVYRSPILAFARDRQLHAVFAPTRKRAGEADDRGAAIVSTLPIADLLLVELPFEKQRRIALGASVADESDGGPARQLRLVNVHFDTNVGLFRGGPSAARRRQARALIDALGRWPAPLLVGGDFNTWWGDDEPAVKALRRAFPDAVAVAERETWRGPLGVGNKLDYVFAKGLSRPATVKRLAHRFGSDHWPLLAVVPMDSLPRPTD